MTIHDAIDYDFADLRLPLNDGFPTGYFSAPPPLIQTAAFQASRSAKSRTTDRSSTRRSAFLHRI